MNIKKVYYTPSRNRLNNLNIISLIWGFLSTALIIIMIVTKPSKLIYLLLLIGIILFFINLKYEKGSRRNNTNDKMELSDMIARTENDEFYIIVIAPNILLKLFDLIILFNLFYCMIIEKTPYINYFITLNFSLLLISFSIKKYYKDIKESKLINNNSQLSTIISKARKNAIGVIKIDDITNVNEDAYDIKVTYMYNNNKQDYNNCTLSKDYLDYEELISEFNKIVNKK